MKKLFVLLACSGGMSSGFLANNIRKAAKKRNLDIDVVARSEFEVEGYLDQTDVLLYAPHLKYLENEFKTKCDPRGIPVSIIEQAVYGMIDGEKCLDLIESLLERKGNNEQTN